MRWLVDNCPAPLVLYDGWAARYIYICIARAQQSFSSSEDLARRVPELSRSNLRMLAEIGALNTIGDIGLHRRDALWQVEKAGHKVGPLLEGSRIQRAPY